MCLCKCASTPGPTWPSGQLDRVSALFQHVLAQDSGYQAGSQRLWSTQSPCQSPAGSCVCRCAQLLKTQTCTYSIVLGAQTILYTYPGSIHHCSINFIKCFIKCKSLALYRNRLLKRPGQSMAPVSHHCAPTIAVLRLCVKVGCAWALGHGVRVVRDMCRAGASLPHLYMRGLVGDLFKGCQPLRTGDFTSCAILLTRQCILKL